MASTGRQAPQTKTSQTPADAPAAEDQTAAEAAAPAKAGKGIVIQMHKTIHGWGEAGSYLEVDPSDDGVQGLLDNEFARKVDKSEVGNLDQANALTPDVPTGGPRSDGT